MQSADDRTQAEKWGARFGWIVGGLLGIIVGFLVTYLTERVILADRVVKAATVAAALSRFFVPVCFLAGALIGHSFGATASTLRYKVLGVSAGLLISVTAWMFLVLIR